MYVQWNKDLEIGISPIDADHRKLVGLFNDFVAATEMGGGSAAVDDTIRELVEYTKYHFGREEVLFNERGCPETILQPHREEHVRLIEEVEAFVEQAKRGTPPQFGAKAIKFLESWLINHIRGTDVSCARAIGVVIAK